MINIEWLKVVSCFRADHDFLPDLLPAVKAILVSLAIATFKTKAGKEKKFQSSWQPIPLLHSFLCCYKIVAFSLQPPLAFSREAEF